MEAMGMMRDLDQIRERDDRGESSRLVVISLGGLAAACVLFAVGVLIGREGDAHHARREDPLARLDALAGQVADAGAPPVTYPDRLLDRGFAAPQGAGENGTAVQTPEALRAAATVPASSLMESTGRLRETPTVPAQLTASPLARVVPASTATAPGAPTTAGSDGPFTLQVSSFRTAPQAQLFAQRLREHGHHAFVASGIGPNGSTWHRVRIGPFTAQHDADRYRSTFEARERLPTFVVRRDAPAHNNER